MLFACPNCRRQYDSGGATSGSKIRCECGDLVTIAAPSAHAPRALRCSACGGPLQDGSRQCGYCSAEVTLEEKRLSSVCPICFARMASDASYCMDCGTAIEPQALVPVPHDASCPRCKGELRSRMIGPMGVIECSHCAGIWMPSGCFEKVVDSVQRDPTSAFAFPEKEVGAPVDYSESVKYLPCIECKDFMVRRNFGERSGIIVDVCADHGYWLDHSELQGVVEFIREGGLVKTQERRLRRAAEESKRAASLAPNNTALFDMESRPRSLGNTDLVDVVVSVGRMFSWLLK